MKDTYLEIKKELSILYPEYIKINSTKENLLRLQELIDIISNLEYRLIQHIKTKNLSQDKNKTRFKPY